MNQLSGLKDIRHYRKFISTFNRAKTIRIGYMYSYIYKSLEYPWETIKWFDLMPITFIFQANYKKRLMVGLNFHHLPVRTRLIWLARVKRLFKKKFVDKKSRKYDTPKRLPLSYRRLMLILLKSKFGVRQYRFDGVADLRIIPNESWDNTFRYIAKTYVGVTYQQKVIQYLKYNIYNKKK